MRTKIQEQIKKLQKSNYYFVLARFISFLLCIVCLYLGVNHHQNYYVLMMILLISFIIFVIINEKYKKQLTHMIYIEEAYKDQDARKSNDWKQFNDDGSEFINKEDYEAIDLDLLGKHSLYQYLCICKTYQGRKKLANTLKNKMTDKQTVLKKQAMIQECSKQEQFMMEMIAYLKALKVKKHNLEVVEVKPYSKIFMSLIFLFILAHGCSFIYMFMFHGHHAYTLICFVILLSLALFMQIKNNVILQTYSEFYEHIKIYDQLLALITKTTFENQDLIQLQNKAKQAYQASNALNQFLWMIHSRNNIIFYMIFNGFLCIDFISILLISKWYQKYGLNFLNQLEVIYDFEVLLSFACFNQAKDHTCIPEISDDLTFSFVELYLPLLKESDAIKNNFTTTNGVILITGSNMSGKTTFMRTIAMNMVLFMCGANICATNANLIPLQLYTSMRIADNVSEGKSTFFEEVLRIKRMIEYAKNNQPMLLLIDEIFKGTNYDDRILCSKTIIELLHQKHVILIITTHDFDLCDIDYVNNYHFTQSFIDNQMLFDYQIKKGRSNTTNALQLLKMVGIDV